MNELFAQQKWYDVNIFGSVDEAKGLKGTQYNFLYGERFKHRSNKVCSMLSFFLNCACPLLGSASTLYLNSDSCTGKNKNNFVRDVLILRVSHGYYEEMWWHFMEVGHTKFRPDQVLGTLGTMQDQEWMH